MSLDITLQGKETDCPECSKCVCCDGTGKIKEELFDTNITHNLTKMASEAGIYKYLWRPEETYVTKASDLIKPLQHGLELLKSDRARFEKFNPPNGWGSYDALVTFAQEYLNKCKENPEATIRVSR